jgi:hypothetical protein
MREKPALFANPGRVQALDVAATWTVLSLDVAPVPGRASAGAIPV